MILVVDWDPNVLRELSEYLLELLPEAEVRIFIDPFWAVKYAYGSQIDMIFTETEMLGLNGSTIIHLIRNRQKKNIPAFYVTGPEELYVKYSHQTCVDGFLKKPIAKESVKKLLAGISGKWGRFTEEPEKRERAEV